jgi:hypothetical protein
VEQIFIQPEINLMRCQMAGGWQLHAAIKLSGEAVLKAGMDLKDS